MAPWAASSCPTFYTGLGLPDGGEPVRQLPVRLGGQVKPGSVQWNAETLDLRFTVTDGAGEMAVHSTGAPPQMFRDGMGVIVEGRVGSGGVFQASGLMVKHSNEYKAPKPGEEAHEKYKTLIKQSAP